MHFKNIFLYLLDWKAKVRRKGREKKERERKGGAKEGRKRKGKVGRRGRESNGKEKEWRKGKGKDEGKVPPATADQAKARSRGFHPDLHMDRRGLVLMPYLVH